MSFYQKAMQIGKKFVKPATLYKLGFNISPMYRRTTGKIIEISDDFKHIRVRIKCNYKNMNYVGSIFGGSLFGAVDPIPMTQFLNIYDEKYVVWDKSAQIRFKRPARETVYADFDVNDAMIASIAQAVNEIKEYEFQVLTKITNKDGSVVFCEVEKTVYIADKTFYKQKIAARQQKS